MNIELRRSRSEQVLITLEGAKSIIKIVHTPSGLVTSVDVVDFRNADMLSWEDLIDELEKLISLKRIPLGRLT